MDSTSRSGSSELIALKVNSLTTYFNIRERFFEYQNINKHFEGRVESYYLSMDRIIDRLIEEGLVTNWWHDLKLNNDDFAKSHFVAVQRAAQSLQRAGKNSFTFFVYPPSDELFISYYADGYLFNIDALDLDIEARNTERDCEKFPVNIRTYHLASQTLMMNNLDIMYCSAKYNKVRHKFKNVLDFCAFFVNRKAIALYICCNVIPFCTEGRGCFDFSVSKSLHKEKCKIKRCPRIVKLNMKQALTFKIKTLQKLSTIVINRHFFNKDTQEYLIGRNIPKHIYNSYLKNYRYLF